MNGAAVGWVFWLQFWRISLFGDLPPLQVRRSADVVDLARWRREHERGAA